MIKDGLDDEVVAESDECQRDAVEEEEEAETKSLGLDIGDNIQIVLNCLNFFFIALNISYLQSCHGLGSRMNKNPGFLLGCIAQIQSMA